MMAGTFISGGAGSLGREIVRHLVATHPTERIVVYSRDEAKHQSMRQEIPEGGATGVRYFLGDICDTYRLKRAMKGCDRVIHAAAMKMIDACETDPVEAYRINVQGTLSVINACIDLGIRRALYVGTDKIPHPCGIYGQTKGLAESLWVQANTYTDITCLFSVRYGNVIHSAKSMFHAWKDLAASGKPIPVTHADATRFYWRLTDAADFILDRMDDGQRGCVYVPKMSSYRIMDIAHTYSSNVQVTGWRCPEKTHEILWSDHECSRTRQHGNYYTIYPQTHPWGGVDMTGDTVTKPLSSGDDPQPWTQQT